MRSRNQFRPSLEALEGRWAPAISIATPPSLCNPGGFDLMITSVPGLTTTTLSVEGIGGDSFIVFENNLGFVGPFAVTDNVTINLTTFPGSLAPTGVTMDFSLFNGEDLEGDLVINLPNATSFHNVGVGSFGGGAILGNGICSTGAVTITSGTGSDFLSLGFSPFFGVGAIDVNGSVSIQAGAGGDVVSFFGGAVGGSVTVTNGNFLQFGASLPTAVEGNFTYSNVTDFTNVAGSFTMFDGVIRGNASITTNARADTVNLLGSIEGNATISMGAGVNTFTLFNGATIGNHLVLTGGNQRDVINLEQGSLVMGNASFTLGSSGATSANANVLNMEGTIMGTKITVSGGGGRDEVRFSGVAIGACLEVRLSSGSDRFELNSNDLAEARLDGGFGADVFVSTILIDFLFSLKNFP